MFIIMKKEDKSEIKKGGLYANVKMSKRSADLMVVGCGLLFIIAVILMVII